MPNTEKLLHQNIGKAISRLEGAPLVVVVLLLVSYVASLLIFGRPARDTRSGAPGSLS